MNRFILFIIFVSSFIIGYSQRTSKVSATYTYYAPETVSIEEAKRVALDRAKIQAIADEFGTIVSQSTTTVITNKNGESNTQFFALGGSNVKGEWIETLGEPIYDVRFENHLLVICCNIRGIAKEISQNRIELIAKPLRNGTTLKYESTEFRDGDDLYLYFKSPTDGFLTIFLIEPKNNVGYCLLPYKHSKGLSYEITADKEYVFFKADDKVICEIDEYQLGCEEDIELDEIHVIFSSHDITQSLASLEENSTAPKLYHLTDYMKWITEMTRKSNVNTTIIPIKVTK